MTTAEAKVKGKFDIFFVTSVRYCIKFKSIFPRKQKNYAINNERNRIWTQITYVTTGI